MFLIKTELRPTEDFNVGLFTLQNIKANQPIWINNGESEKWFYGLESVPDGLLNTVKKYGFYDKDNLLKLPLDDKRYIRKLLTNGNLTFDGHGNMITLKDISQNEELIILIN